MFDWGSIYAFIYSIQEVYAKHVSSCMLQSPDWLMNNPMPRSCAAVLKWKAQVDELIRYEEFVIEDNRE